MASHPDTKNNIMKKLSLSLLLCFVVCLATFAQQNFDIYITGDATEFGWTLANPEGSGLQKQAEGKYTWRGKLRQGYFFRFLTTASWDPTYTAVDDSGLTVQEGTFPVAYDVEQRSSQPAFKVGTGGIYTITLDTEALSMTLKLEELVVETDLYMIGIGTPSGWSTGNARNFKMREDNRRYTWTGPLTKAHADDDTGDGRFFFLANGSGDWWPRYISEDITEKSQTIEPGKTYRITRHDTSAAESLPGWADPGFVVATPGIYTITVELSDDLSTGTFSISPSTISIIGPAVSGSWHSGELSKYKFINNGDGTLTFAGNLSTASESKDDSGKFRFNKPGDWWPAFVPADDANVAVNREGDYDIKWSPNESPAFKINTEGYFTITIDLNGDKPKMNIKRNGNMVEIPDDALTELFICGNALNGVPGGWSQNEDYIRPMKATLNPGEFTWTGTLYEGCEYKFRYNGPENGDWSGLVADYPDNHTVEAGETHSIVATGDGVPDSKFVLASTGEYTITASTYGESKTMTIVPAGEEDGVEAVLTTSSSTARYFNLQGIEVSSPRSGSLYIVVKDGKTLKTIY